MTDNVYECETGTISKIFSSSTQLGNVLMCLTLVPCMIACSVTQTKCTMVQQIFKGCHIHDVMPGNIRCLRETADTTFIIRNSAVRDKVA